MSRREPWRIPEDLDLSGLTDDDLKVLGQLSDRIDQASGGKTEWQDHSDIYFDEMAKRGLWVPTDAVAA